MSLQQTCDPARAPQQMGPAGAALMAWAHGNASSSSNATQSSTVGPLYNWGLGDPCTWRWLGVRCNGSAVTGLNFSTAVTSPLRLDPRTVDWDALANVTTLRTLDLRVSACWLWKASRL
jgi:hypothetical protein